MMQDYIFDVLRYAVGPLVSRATEAVRVDNVAFFYSFHLDSWAVFAAGP